MDLFNIHSTNDVLSCLHTKVVITYIRYMYM
jgi:hypothetical protein